MQPIPIDDDDDEKSSDNLQKVVDLQMVLKSMKKRMKELEQKNKNMIGRILQLEKSNEEKEIEINRLKNNLKNSNLCTFKKTGRGMFRQEFYRCYTCGFDERSRKGVCKFCKDTCHKGHNIKFMGYPPSFCDCGAGAGKAPCKCLT